MTFRSSLALASLTFVFACGPKEPPRQASIAETADPNTENSPEAPNSNSSSSGGSGKGGDVLGSPSGGKPVAGKGGDAPHVTSLAPFAEGVKWGITHAELTKQFTATGGTIWKDYDEKLTKARVGPEQTALEAEREQAKAAFARSYIEFKDTPTGYDTTGIKSEYTYKNKESLMWIERQGKKRYYFFINDRLWKMYDEVPLAEGGPMGKGYIEAVNKLNGQLSATGRMMHPDEKKGIFATTVDWKDSTSRLRAVDRSSERVVGIAIEETATASNITALRPNKPADPNEIDPSILAVTRGGPSDPNAATPAPSASAGKKGPATPPKKK